MEWNTGITLTGVAKLPKMLVRNSNRWHSLAPSRTAHHKVGVAETFNKTPVLLQADLYVMRVIPFLVCLEFLLLESKQISSESLSGTETFSYSTV